MVEKSEIDYKFENNSNNKFKISASIITQDESNKWEDEENKKP